MPSSRSLARARVPAALSLLLALALAATPLASYAEEPTGSAEPTATAEPTVSAEPSTTTEPSATAEPTATSGTAEPTATPTTAPMVVFPAATRIGPDSPAYVVEVDAPQFERVQVVTRTWATQAPAVGPVEVQFPKDGTMQVQVLGCTEADGCRELAVSDPLVVRRSLGLALPAAMEHRVSPSRPEVLLALPQGESDREGRLTWRVLARDGAALATGEAVYRPDPRFTDAATFDLRLPETLADGEYRIEIDAVDVVEGHGELRSSTSGTVVWDTRVKVRMSLQHDELYPAHDGYRDYLYISLRAEEWAVTGRIEVVNGSGRVVRTLMDVSDGSISGGGRRWNGLDEAGERVPDGTYTVRGTFSDFVENRSVVELPVLLGSGTLRTIRWKQTFRAADTVIDTSVGRCSSYRTPSSRRDRGSFQLASQTRCRKPAQSHAIALSGIYLPPSVGVTYDDLTVEMKGGPSLRSRNAYAVLGFVRKDDTLGQRTVLTGAYGRHRARLPKPGASVRTEEDGRHFVLWQAGLSEGSWWDVESYTVSARIKVLR